jgi:hypothetical protein
MKYLRRFESHYEEKDLQETIDEVLDSLNRKGNMSESEKEFMMEASNGTIKKVTLPKSSGNFWGDMSNPHNIGIMWIGKDNVWKILTEESESNDDDEDDWHKRKSREIMEYGKKLPEIVPILNEIAKKQIEDKEYYHSMGNKLKEFSKKLPKSQIYTFEQKVDYAIRNLDGMMNQFGPLIKSIKIGDDGYEKS